MAVTIVLGGVSTCALQYLLVERLIRPVTARALASGPPTEPLVPGVAARLTMAWTLATGVPIVGMAAIAVVALVDDDPDSSTAAAILFLAGLALSVGLVAMLFAARSISDPIAALRTSLARVEGGDFGARTSVDDGSEVGLLQAGFNRMAAGLGERERLRDAVRRAGEDEAARWSLGEAVTLRGREAETRLAIAAA